MPQISLSFRSSQRHKNLEDQRRPNHYNGGHQRIHPRLKNQEFHRQTRILVINYRYTLVFGTRNHKRKQNAIGNRWNIGMTGYHNFLRRVSPLPLWSKIRPQTFVEKNPTSSCLWKRKPTPKITNRENNYTSSPKGSKNIYLETRATYQTIGNSPETLRPRKYSILPSLSRSNYII